MLLRMRIIVLRPALDSCSLISFASCASRPLSSLPVAGCTDEDLHVDVYRFQHASCTELVLRGSRVRLIVKRKALHGKAKLTSNVCS